jgi:hypothetical protein
MGSGVRLMKGLLQEERAEQRDEILLQEEGEEQGMPMKVFCKRREGWPMKCHLQKEQAERGQKEQAERGGWSKVSAKVPGQLPIIGVIINYIY